MPSEKFFVHKEDGSLVRLKGRLVRFLDEEPPTGSDKSAIRTALEVSPDAEGLVQADVGTGPNQIPTMGMLGTMSLQDADGVSMGTVTIDGDAEVGATSTDHTRLTISSPNNKDGQLSFDDTDGSLRGFVVYDHAQDKLKMGSGGANAIYVDSSQRVGIGGSPSAILSVESSTYPRATFGYGGSSAEHRLAWDSAKFNIVADSGNVAGSSEIGFYVDNVKRFAINASGNLVSSGGGIDFGSAATSAGQGTGTTGTPANSVLSDYEFGSWTPTFLMSGSSNFAALTMDVVAAQYVKVGRHVHCQAYIRTDNVDTSGATGYVTISGLPFVSDATSGNNGGASIHNSARWTNAPTTGNVPPNTARLYLQRNGTTGVSTLTAADLVNGAAANQNEVVFTASYIAST